MSQASLFVTGYLPERDRLIGKQEEGVRRLREDCAVLSVEEDFRPIACRHALQKEGTVSEWLRPNGKTRALRKALLEGEGLLLVSGKNDCVLLFRGLLEASGTVFAVRAPFCAPAVFRALQLCGRSCTVFPSRAFGDVRNATLSDELCGWLEELLFYTDRILGPTPLCAMTRARIIADFLGCRADRFALPATPLPISQTDDLRLTAFLLCVFLSLRARNGRLTASLAPPEDEHLPLSCRVCLTEQNATASKVACISEDALPFLSLDAFRDIHLSQSENGLTLEATFPVLSRREDHTPVLHAHLDRTLTLSMELSLDNSTED